MNICGLIASRDPIFSFNPAKGWRSLSGIPPSCWSAHFSLCLGNVGQHRCRLVLAIQSVTQG